MLRAIVAGYLLGVLWAQPPPPPHGPPGAPRPRPDPRRIDDQLAHLRQRLSQPEPADPDPALLYKTARLWTGVAEQYRNKGQLAAADRSASGADALLRAADHFRHLHDPRHPPPPPGDEIARHLERVYFRVQQADFFAHYLSEAAADGLPQLVRSLYQRALEAYDRRDFAMADEYAKAADDTVQGLEDFAQAAAPTRAPPRLPGGKG